MIIVAHLLICNNSSNGLSGAVDRRFNLSCDVTVVTADLSDKERLVSLVGAAGSASVS